LSIFGSILSKIFHHAGAPAPDPQAVAAATTTSAPAPDGPAPATPAAAGAPTAPIGGGAIAGGSAQVVDVAAVLEGLAAKNPQKLDWRHSIVDMMKLLDLDSSLSSRKQLAQELHYSGSTDDSATMNLWLHGQVMTKLAENGGKVPDDLKA
jgi:hypothetical protein